MNKVEKIILGTAQLGLSYGINNKLGKPSAGDSLEILKTANEYGIRYLDTAEAYGDAQEVIGMYHSHSINKFKIITKLTGSSIETFGNIIKVIDRDRKILQVDSIYGYLFHSFQLYQNYFDTNIFKELKANNSIYKVGVSVYTNEEAAVVANDNDIDIVQLPFNLLDNINLRGEILQILKEKGKEIHVRSVFLQGLFFIETEMLPDNLRPLGNYLKTISNIAHDYNLSIKDMAMLYVLQNEFVDKIIIGIDSLQQLNEHIDFLKSAEVNSHIDIKSVNVVEKELLNPANW